MFVGYKSGYRLNAVLLGVISTNFVPSPIATQLCHSSGNY